MTTKIFHDWYFLPDIVPGDESKQTERADTSGTAGGKKERDHMAGRSGNGKIILKRMLNRMRG
jgi:hypothetical protein